MISWQVRWIRNRGSRHLRPERVDVGGHVHHLDGGKCRLTFCHRQRFEDSSGDGYDGRIPFEVTSKFSSSNSATSLGSHSYRSSYISSSTGHSGQ